MLAPFLLYVEAVRVHSIVGGSWVTPGRRCHEASGVAGRCFRLNQRVYINKTQYFEKVGREMNEAMNQCRGKSSIWPGHTPSGSLSLKAGQVLRADGRLVCGVINLLKTGGEFLFIFRSNTVKMPVQVQVQIAVQTFITLFKCRPFLRYKSHIKEA